MLEKWQFRSCPVISKDGILMGVVSVSEIDVAAIKGQLDRPVSGYMKLRFAVSRETAVSECERILVDEDEGCIPVVANYEDPKKQWRLAGLVTRSTILETHEYYRSESYYRPLTQYIPPPAKKYNAAPAGAPAFFDSKTLAAGVSGLRPGAGWVDVAQEVRNVRRSEVIQEVKALEVSQEVQNVRRSEGSVEEPGPGT